MPNSLLTISDITKESLMILQDELLFPGLVVQAYDSSFAKTGAKIGDTLRIRKPAQFITNTQEDLSSLVSEYNEESITLKVSNRRNVALSFGRQEQTLSLNAVGNEVLRAPMAQIASDMEMDCLQNVMAGVGNTVVATGSSGTKLTYADVLRAGAKMSSQTCPLDMRSFLVNPFDQAGLIDELKGLFHSGSKLDEQYKKGQFGRQTAGFDWFMSNRVSSDLITVPGDIAGTLTATPIAGALTLSVGQFGASDVIMKGQTFTIAGIYAVHPQTKQSTGELFQFTVLESVTMSSGAGVLKIGSSQNEGGLANGIHWNGAKKNVSAQPTSGLVVTLTGVANTTYRQNLAFQKNAFAVATVDEMAFDGGIENSIQQYNGVSLRIARAGSVLTNQNLCRADVLFGTAVLRPEYACRLWVKVS
jgi:hypothetical protein